MKTCWCRRVLLAELCLVLCLNLDFRSEASNTLELTLLHTNDMHSRIEETSVDSSKCHTGAGQCFAGVARMFTKISEIRKTEKNVLLLDGGDQSQGTVWFNFYNGQEVAHFMNKLGYDAMAFGNHEFDNGVDSLIENFLLKVNFPVVNANIKEAQGKAVKLSRYFKPYALLNVSTEKVAVIGYTTTETPDLSSPGPNLKFEDVVKALQEQVDNLKALGINKFIALGHSGFEADKEIAKRVKGIDIVVGGHSNTFLFSGNPPSTEKPVDKYPVFVRSDDGRQVPVVQAYAFGKYLGKLKVTFDKAGNVVKADGNPILIDSSIRQDSGVLQDVKEWREALDRNYSQSVGQTLVYLNGTFEECRFRECNLGNLICDAMIYSSNNYKNHVNVCMLNSGAIRSPIDEKHNGGTITMEEIFNVLPFRGTFDVVQLKGSTMKEAFEYAVHRYGLNTGEFLQVSGVHVEYDITKPSGKRVLSLKILCMACRVPTFEPVDPQKTYTVVMSSYMVTGGDGFSMIKSGILKHSKGELDNFVLSRYISAMKRVYPAVEGRIVIKDASSAKSKSC